ncbi:MAG: isoleucine--tRNA ligase [Chloroflexota bacterium]
MYQPVSSSVDIPSLEHEILEFWQEIRAFETLIEQLRDKPVYSFIDGPITANNPMGVHHAWGRTYKDILQRYHAMRGFNQRWQNGFDCQGLWVEVEVEKELGFNSKREIEEYGLAEFAKRCRERVEKFAAIITQQSERLGQWMRWDDSYYTFSDDNIQHIWHFLKTCHERGWLYKGARSMPWCVRCGTGLSQHELVGTDSYRDVTHPSIFLRLPIDGREQEYFLVWTTTPWTLTANVALAVNPELEYVRVKQGEQTYILAPRTVGLLQGEYEQVGSLRGSEMVGWSYRGPFDELEAANQIKHRVIPWSDVGEEEGTGIVHIAPGCGAEDFELSKVEHLDVIVPINEAGEYHAGFGEFSGRDVRGVREAVFANLREKDLVYRIQDYTHRYPSCWRCGQELFFRLADEWFISAQEIREPMKAASANVDWVPPSAGKRMDDWLNNMGDWNISRKRYWGLPLPFYPCTDCGTLTVIGSMAELRERAESGLEQLQELHRPWIDAVKVRCSACNSVVERVPEVGDAWLDAGIVPFSTLHYMSDRQYWETWFPAHFITEMREQIRLWFYSMLFMSVTLENTAPYRRVLAYEKLMDEQGKPMHKSLGNAIWFDEAAEKMGADVMRWLYTGQNIQANLNFGYGPAEDVKRKLLMLWNVYSFFVTYARLDGFVPPADGTFDTTTLRLIDRWILSRFQAVVEGTHSALQALNPPEVTRLVDAFVDDLSTWYVRRSRRRFWKSESDADKQAAYFTLYTSLTELTRLLAPFLPFLSESMYQNLVRSVNEAAHESVHHTAFPTPNPELRDEALERLVGQVRQVVSLGRAVRNQVNIRVRQPLARVSVAVPSGSSDLADELRREIAEELNVKEIEWGVDLGRMVRTVARPNPSVLGPRLGKEFPRVLLALRAGEFSLSEDGRIQVLGHTLESESVTVSVEPLEGFAAAAANGVTVALDTELTDDLIAEGRARELVHRIQTMRKDAGFNVEDRIVTCYDSSSGLAAVMNTYESYIRQETLTERLVANGPDQGFRWNGAIDGLAITLTVCRVTEPS